MASGAVAIDMPAEFLEQVAERAAELLAAQRELEPDEPAGYLDVAGAASFLACPTSRIYRLVSAKRIPHHRDGSRLLFDRDELREFVRQGGAVSP